MYLYTVEWMITNTLLLLFILIIFYMDICAHLMLRYQFECVNSCYCSMSRYITQARALDKNGTCSKRMYKIMTQAATVFLQCLCELLFTCTGKTKHIRCPGCI